MYITIGGESPAPLFAAAANGTNTAINTAAAIFIFEELQNFTKKTTLQGAELSGLHVTRYAPKVWSS